MQTLRIVLNGMAQAVSKYETASSRESIIFDFLRQLSVRPKMRQVLLRTGYGMGMLTDERKALIAKPTVKLPGKGGQGVSITIDFVLTAAHRDVFVMLSELTD